MTRKSKENICEEFRISLNLVLKKFRQNGEQKELEFPSSFSPGQRAYIHRYCQKLGLKSKSRGCGANRFLTVYKKEGSTIVQADAIFTLGKASQHHVMHLLQRYSVSARERQELLPPTERDRLAIQDIRESSRATGRLGAGIPQIPPYRDSDMTDMRHSLPIWNSREEIIQSILCHQVVMICGETGCGKTTQVPQYILDHCGLTGQPCHIICTQPRRIAAVSIAERVAAERNEKIGQTVGFQIRLESRVSLKTLLIYCTSGVLLRTLMGGDAFAATTTHIIVDELHERDKFNDFLLIILRDLLLKFRSLKLILMSAVLDTQQFMKYFGGCPVIEVPGRMFSVRPYFLENILKFTGYINKSMRKYRGNMKKLKIQQRHLESWCSSVSGNAVSGQAEGGSEEKCVTHEASNENFPFFQDTLEKVDIYPPLAAKMDKALHDAWMSGRDENFSYLLHVLLSENISVNYQHSDTSVTSLMVAAGRGNLNSVEQLLNLGANVQMQSSNGWTAIDFAKNFDQKEAKDMLEAHCADSATQQQQPPNDTTLYDDALAEEPTEEEKLLLDAYQYGADDDKIDTDLIMSLIKYICYNQQEGSILVFLPGYDDIVLLKEKLTTEERSFVDYSRLIICTLHSQMQNSDHRRAFKPAPQGARKIILSTNIAETSITIDDVVYVLDSGRVKEKTFDAVLGTTQLKTGWVSQASAIQRRGRAGRCQPGVCYHLFSRKRFCSFQKFQIPEILRVPIHELCLQAKLLAPPNMPIADFLARAPDPPPFMVTRNAVTLLKTIDALDPWEELTELGLHLLDLPVEPQLGKMVLFSAVLKCLDPILTIACTLAYRDPFLLPSQPSEKRTALIAKKKFACGTFSDHLALLRAFQGWQKAKADGYEHSFCSKNYLSPSTMEMISGMRMQLLNQLRASGFVRSRGGTGDLRDLNTNSDAWPVVRAALCAGCYPNLIRIDRERQQLITQRENKVRFHPSSVLNKFPVTGKETVSSLHGEVLASLPSDWLVYEELSRVGAMCYAQCCTLMSPVTVALFCGPARLPFEALHELDGGRPEESDSEDDLTADSQKATLRLDDWVTFRIDHQVARLAIQLRQKLYALVLRRIHMPAKPWSQVDEAVVRCIVAVLIAEEQDLGLPQPGSNAMRAPYINPNEYFQTPIYRTPRITTHHPVGGSSHSSQHATHAFQHQHQQLPQESVAIRPNPSVFDSSGRAYGATRRPMMDKQRGLLYAPGDALECSSVQSISSSCGSINTSPSISPCPSRSDQRRLSAMFEQHSLNMAPKIKYYVIKAQNPKSLDLSMLTGTWAFSPNTERKLLAAVKEGRDVILIFSLHGSGHFQGLARFIPHLVDQRADSFSRHLGNFYYVEWLKRADIPFQNTQHLVNAWNENRKVQISRDGQELEPSVGESLCRLWENFPILLQLTESLAASSREQQPMQQMQQSWPSAKPPSFPVQSYSSSRPPKL